MSTPANVSAYPAGPGSSAPAWTSVDAAAAQRTSVTRLRRYLGRECLDYFTVGLVIAVLLVIATKLALVNVVIEGVRIVYAPGTVAISLCISLLVFAIVVPAQYLRPMISAGATRRAAMVAFSQVAVLAALGVGLLTTVAAILPPSVLAFGDSTVTHSASILPPGMVGSQGALDTPWGAGGAAVLYTLAFIAAGAVVALAILRFGWVGGVASGILAWLLVAPGVFSMAEFVFGPLSSATLLAGYAAGIVVLAIASVLMLRDLPMRQPAAQS